MKRNSLLIATLFVTIIAGAQSINLHMNNGEVIKYNSAEVDYIDFTENSEPDNPDSPIAYTSCPDENHPHLIDLGLPSGTKWACCNVGAQKPEDYGGYFAWGETKEKSSYTEDNYLGGKGTSCDIGKDIASTPYDAATANWGGPWVMPSMEQMNELKSNCTSEWTTKNGVNGRRYTGSNGASIFIPAAGIRLNQDLSLTGLCGYYWLSTLSESVKINACYLYFRSERVYTPDGRRDYGLSVRPVRKN